jgi:formylglycine-generating enzyme required for sulfatase activity
VSRLLVLAAFITTLGLPGLVSANGIILVPAGAFWMGRDGGAPDEAPAHRVFVRDFWIERHKVTNAEFTAFLDARGITTIHGERRFDVDDADARIRRVGGRWLADPGYEDHPAVEVSWFGARDYCAWKGRRLPTEAEWEKAARGGHAAARYPWGDAPPPPARFAAPPRARDTPANPLGLYGLSGVCHEWCADWYDDAYYAVSPARNPRGPVAGTRRASRGGAWRHADPWSPVAHRSSLPPHLRYSDYGVRLARGHLE